MVSVGDRVRLGTNGVSEFEVLELVDEKTALVQTVEDAPGRYPFPTLIRFIVPAADPV
ncbi:hypothetical protein [Nocardia sp. NBC_00511]|uniref:hypothetical protein n=1 Tax=Nocardia sp. NBC_00511 TaxID=2903591 RepID=UPI002F91BCED